MLLLKDNFQKEVKSRLSRRYKNEHVLKILFYSINEGNQVDVITNSKESEEWTHLCIRNIEMKAQRKVKLSFP